MATINDLPKLEGIRDYFVGEIWDLLIEKGCFGNHSSPLYMEALSIMDDARNLVDIVFDDKISPEAKDERIENTTQSLSKRLTTLKATLCE